MKKNIIGLVILAILGAVAYYVIQQRGQGTMKPALHNFAVEDTTSVTKIFLADKYGRKVLLERKSAIEWQVNGQFKARKDLVDVLMRTIARVEMKAPVAQSAHNTIVKLMAVKSVKVEIYAGDDRVKTYFVGDATNDNMGTYMLLEGSSEPFICHMPGFVGYLTPRFVADPLVWRDTEVFANRLPQIAELEIDYNEYPEKSFRIKRSKKGVFELMSLLPAPKSVGVFDTVGVMRYLLGYDNIRFETVQAYDTHRVDSIVNSRWYYKIKLTEPNGKVRTVTTYRIPSDPDEVDFNGQPMDWDPDQMHAVINGNTKEIVLAQFHSFDRLTVDYTRFVGAPKK